jgi:acetyltransferase
VPDSDLPKLAIRPYPRQYEGHWVAADGTRFFIRPIRPDDEELIRRFHETLSESSVFRRYAHVVRLDQRISHNRLIRSCFIDYDREMALVALPEEAPSPAIVAVGRLIKAHENDEAEFALLVTDTFQRHGLGAELLRRLIDIGRREGVGRIVGHILADNSAMLRVCKRLGFKTAFEDDGSMVDAYLDLAR